MSNDKETKNNLHVEEHEKDLLLDHAYDGIQELNHPLPSWWNFIFWIAIFFSVAYLLYYAFFGGKSLRQEFVEDYTRVMKLQEEEKKKHGTFDEKRFALLVSQDGLKKGEEIFTNNCVACHMEKGRGDIGPNLTDEYWLWAKGTPETIYPVVYNGVPDNGMPTWSETLTSDEIYQVVSYVQSLHNTHAKNGKAPQGNKIE
jgi:cytochrome c oxidase cbb3-type subunit 3